MCCVDGNPSVIYDFSKTKEFSMAMQVSGFTSDKLTFNSDFQTAAITGAVKENGFALLFSLPSEKVTTEAAKQGMIALQALSVEDVESNFDTLLEKGNLVQLSSSPNNPKFLRYSKLSDGVKDAKTYLAWKRFTPSILIYPANGEKPHPHKIDYKVVADNEGLLVKKFPEQVRVLFKDLINALPELEKEINKAYNNTRLCIAKVKAENAGQKAVEAAASKPKEQLPREALKPLMQTVATQQAIKVN